MRHFIAIGPGAGSGWGSTEEEAVANMLKGGVRPDERYETFEVHPKTKINDVGIMSFPKGHPPISLGVTNPKRKQKSQTAGYVDVIGRTSETTKGVPSLDFRGPAKQKSKPKVRVTEAEHTRILNLAAQMRRRGPVAPVLTGDEAKLRCAVDALNKIRRMGYRSDVEKTAETVLAITRVAESALRTVGE